MGHSGDIYFQFKTTAENGVLVNSRGPSDYIKIMLVGKFVARFVMLYVFKIIGLIFYDENALILLNF